MIRNYILTGIRNLKKHLGYSLINIVGLGLGLSVCLLLVVWITHESSYDTFHTKADRIYRASLEYSFGGQVARTAVSPNALLPALLTLPETETGVRVATPGRWSPFIVRNGEKLFQETCFYFADSTFFSVFSYKLIKGNPDKALIEPYSVILTESSARKYFGDEDAMGKTLRVNNDKEYLVTGILEDVPSNSFLQFDLLGSFNSLSAGRGEPSWWSANYQTFVVPHPGTSLPALNGKINEMASNAVANDLQGKGDYVRYNFMPLTDLHLRSDYNGEPEVVSDIKYIYIFTAIAILVLVIACINYINLATARASDRAREVGIRKVVGALRKQLFLQFTGESVIITLLSFCLAFLLAQVMLPFFNDLTGKDFNYKQLLDPSFVAISFPALVIIALLAGTYPAFALTSFKPVLVLKGNFKSSGKGIWLRRSLVVLQFCISVILIVGTLVIIKQLDFIQDKKLGFDRNHSIIVPLESHKVFESFKAELLRNGLATHVARGSESPAQVLGGYAINREEGSSLGIMIAGLVVDEEYVPAMGMEIVTGRNFTRDDVERAKRDNVYTFILNESALQHLSIDVSDAIGKRVAMGERKGEIIGVVSDFHFSSLHNLISPLVMFPEEDQLAKIFIKLAPGDLPDMLDKIKNISTTLMPHRPFEFEFLDQQYAALYVAEQRMGNIFIVFAVLAIVIACLGLLGLISFSAAQKTKEIGIRKVMGATGTDIIMLITRDFTRLVVIAIALGLPLAYWIMNQWLSDFAYRTAIGTGPVVTASLLCIFIALGTAAFQAIKAARGNPVKALREN